MTGKRKEFGKGGKKKVGSRTIWKPISLGFHPTGGFPMREDIGTRRRVLRSLATPLLVSPTGTAKFR